MKFTLILALIVQIAIVCAEDSQKSLKDIEIELLAEKIHLLRERLSVLEMKKELINEMKSNDAEQSSLILGSNNPKTIDYLVEVAQRKISGYYEEFNKVYNKLVKRAHAGIPFDEGYSEPQKAVINERFHLKFDNPIVAYELIQTRSLKYQQSK